MSAATGELTTNPLAEPMPRAVTVRGLCGGSGVDMSPEGRQYASDPAWAAARSVCRGCPVVQVCGEWGLRNPEETQLSVWAGLDPGQWADLRRTGRMPNARRPLVEQKRPRRAAVAVDVAVGAEAA